MIPKHIILHHSLTKDGQTVNTRAIRRWHIEHNGWSDIGYHFVIEKVQNEIEIFCGRMLGQRGAHVKESGMNSKSFGICFVGNYDLAPPPPDMWNKGLLLVRSLMGTFNIPRTNVRGHKDYAPYKSCPGDRFDLDAFRRSL